MTIASCTKYCRILVAKKSLKIIFLTIFLLFNFFIGVFLILHLHDAGMGLVIPFKIRYAIKEQIRQVQNLPYILNKFKSSELPTYNLLIDEAELSALNKSLPSAGTGLSDDNKNYQKAAFVHDNKEYKVKIKYRGTADVHWLYPKKSLRIKFDKENFFEGFRELNLIIPEDRAFAIEALNDYRARKIGLASPYKGFATLTINGKNYGVYMVFEQWDSEFLERNELPSEANLYGDDYGKFENVKIYSNNYFWKKYNSDTVNKIDNFSEIGKLLDLVKDSPDEEFYKKIFNLLDEENFYGWQVHSVLARSLHQCNDGNARMVFNNATGKFQFIPWDTGIDVNTFGITDDPAGDGFAGNAIGYNALVERVLKNPEFLLKRNSLLWDYVKDDNNLKEDMEVYDDVWKQIKVAVYKDDAKEYPNSFFDNEVERYRDLVIENYNNVRAYLSKMEFFADVHMNAAQNQNKIPVMVDILAKSNVPFELNMEIKNIEPQPNADLLVYYDADGDGNFQKSDKNVGTIPFDSATGKYDQAKLNILLRTEMELEDKPEMERRLLAKETAHRFFLIPRTGENLKISYLEADFESINYLSQEKNKPQAITYLDDSVFYYFNKIDESAGQFVSENSIFKKISNKEVVLYGGSYIVSNDIIIPKGLLVYIKPGAVMYFKKGVSLVSYSPIIARGEKNHPIRVLAVNPDEPRGTFAVVGAQKNKSEFVYAVFENGGEAYINGIFFSGMLALHRSDVMIENCEFRYAKSDDGLNVKYADAVVRRSLFEKNSSDALDFDYTTGEISESSFLDNGGDGVDISGSELEIKNNIMKNLADKGISVGERSVPKITGNTISGCAIGVASKDGSAAELIDNKITKNKVGLAAYLKKPLYAIGGKIISRNTELSENEKDTEQDGFSGIEFK